MTDRDKQIVDMYTAGQHPADIAPKFGVTMRTVQRVVKDNGASRTRSEAFKLAIQTGRMKYHRKDPSLLYKANKASIPVAVRLETLNKFNSRCVKCGNTPADGIRIEIDHINDVATDNRPENLQVLCALCNRGKTMLRRQYNANDHS